MQGLLKRTEVLGAALFVGPVLFPWELVPGYEPFGWIDLAAVPVMALGFVMFFRRHRL
jgi:hypothetical protein